MNSNGILLLKTLLVSTSRRNIRRYSKDKKKRGRIVGETIGTVLLYIMLIAYCTAMCVGYGIAGLIEAVPVLCALTISMLAFFLTVFKANGYLFNFREYDMLMSLPFEAKTVAACRFLYMYVKSLPWYLCISLAMMIGYGIRVRPSAAVYLLWFVLSLFLPVIPMLAAAFLGFLIAKASAGFRKTGLVQTVLTFVFAIFCFSLRFIITEIFRDGKAEAALETISETTDRAAGIYLPAAWFSRAVTDSDIMAALLLAAASLLLFTVLFTGVGRSYRNINSALKSHAAAKKYRMTGQKRRSAVIAVAFKEFRRLTGSATYMTNAAMGEVLAALFGIVTLLFGFDRITEIVTQGAPVDPAVLRPAIPYIMYFFIGMVSTTACSPSLEGKNYWIVQSLPIEKKTLYRGKMLFNMLLTVPFMSFGILCLCLSSRTPVPDTALYLMLGFALCAFSTAWGCVCGIRHMRLDWENEVEVIKQGSAVTLYMLPNMLATMGLIVLAVFLGMRMDHRLLTVALVLATSALALLSYGRAMALAEKST